MKSPGPMPLPVSFRLDPAVMQTLYARHLDNVWRQHMDALPVGSPAASDSFVALDRVRRTDFYGDVLEPWDIGHAAWFSIDDTRKHRVALSINRSPARGPFTSAELQASHELLPHLRRAIQLRSLLDSDHEQQRLALGVLDRLASGVLIVDSDTRVLFANIAAEKIVGAQDVLVMTDGTIRPRQRELGDVFQEASRVRHRWRTRRLASAGTPVTAASGVRAGHTARRHARGVAVGSGAAGAPRRSSCRIRNVRSSPRSISGRFTSSAPRRRASPG